MAYWTEHSNQSILDCKEMEYLQGSLSRKKVSLFYTDFAESSFKCEPTDNLTCFEWNITISSQNDI